MSFISQDVMNAPEGLFQSDATAQFQLGARCKTDDGRVYRYATAGAVALVPGTLVQAAAEVTNHQNVAPTATFAIGATQVTVTLGATAVTANYYAQGFMVGSETPGQGQMYKISSHPAADSGATLTLTLEDPLIVAVTTSSHFDLVPNQYKGVVINPTTATSNPVGVAIYAIPAGESGWIQSGGITNVLADGTVTVGTSLVASNATAGAVEALTGVQAAIGLAVTGIATTEYGAVRLLLDS